MAFSFSTFPTLLRCALLRWRWIIDTSYSPLISPFYLSSRANKPAHPVGPFMNFVHLCWIFFFSTRFN